MRKIDTERKLRTKERWDEVKRRYAKFAKIRKLMNLRNGHLLDPFQAEAFRRSLMLSCEVVQMGQSDEALPIFVPSHNSNWGRAWN
jgi:hypothetical protein